MQEDNKDHGGRGHRPKGARQDGSLGVLLDSCGHFFAHRIGGSTRGQGSVLTLIGQHPGVTQRELVELLGIHPASLSELLMKLERKGLVEKEKDENDRRVARVRLTETGEQALQGPEPELETADPFQVLTAEEQEALKQLLGKLLADWEARYPAERGRGRHGGHGGHREHGGAREDGHPHPGGRPQGAPSAREESREDVYERTV